MDVDMRLRMFQKLCLMLIKGVWVRLCVFRLCIWDRERKREREREREREKEDQQCVLLSLNGWAHLCDRREEKNSFRRMPIVRCLLKINVIILNINDALLCNFCFWADFAFIFSRQFVIRESLLFCRMANARKEFCHLMTWKRRRLEFVIPKKTIFRFIRWALECSNTS